MVIRFLGKWPISGVRLQKTPLSICGKNRPCLFDCSSQCYSNRNAKTKALYEIASVLGTGGM